MGISSPENKRNSLMKIAPRILLGLALLTFLVISTQPLTQMAPQTGAPPAEPAPSQSGQAEAQNEPVACEEQTQKAIEQTINSQTRAFADNNFELAYSFASPSFRSSVSLNGFVTIIASSYGPLIESSELRFSDCLANSNGGFALIDVRFLQGGDFVYGLRYLMADTSDGWRVDGAGDLEVVGEGT